MKIIKSGEVIGELRDKPKDFEGGCKRNVVWAVVGDVELKLATYSNFERALEVSRALHDAYFNNQPEFILPKEWFV